MMTDTNEKERQDFSPPRGEVTPPREAVPAAPAHCVNHPEKKAFRACRKCARNFCVKCMVHYNYTYYCEACGEEVKYGPAAGGEIAPEEEAEPLLERIESREALRAFRLALIGLIPALGIVLAPIALVIGLIAMSHTPVQPGRETSNKALHSVLIASGSFILQLVGVVIVASLLS
jgi:hypothetical protein